MKTNLYFSDHQSKLYEQKKPKSTERTNKKNKYLNAKETQLFLKL